MPPIVYENGLGPAVCAELQIEVADTVADFKYGVNTDVNTGVSVTRGGNTLFEVMGIC